MVDGGLSEPTSPTSDRSDAETRVTLACWSTQTTQNDCTEREMTARAPTPAKSACSPDSSMTTSLDRRACRICQSETGEMVRPCGCSGTMGDIHEVCLSKWVSTSHKHICEICHQSYAKSGWRFKTPRLWEKPQLGAQELTTLIVVGGLLFSLVYLVLLFDERHFMERVSQHGLPCRSDDMGRIVVFVVLLCALLGTILGILRHLRDYFTAQMEIRFIDKTSCTTSE